MLRDDPIIESLERTGLAPWQKDEQPICPICNNTCDTIYRNEEGDIVGCNECLTPYDAWELLDYE